MHCYYINLTSAQDRKAFVTDNFKTHAPEWALHRVEAINAQAEAVAALNGKIRPVEKAVFLSHVQALKQSLKNNEPALILEDDVLIGPRTVRQINMGLIGLQDQPWDILFTDICISSLTPMLKLLRRKPLLQQNRKIEIVPLKATHFAGMTSYIVNPRSKQKIYDHFRSIKSLNIPIDLYLRRLVWKGQLNAQCIFPFATTLSSFAENTQIQLTDTQFTDEVLNSFRRLMWAEADAKTVNDHLTEIIDHSLISKDTKAFSTLITAMLSPQFKYK